LACSGTKNGGNTKKKETDSKNSKLAKKGWASGNRVVLFVDAFPVLPYSYLPSWLEERKVTWEGWGRGEKGKTKRDRLSPTLLSKGVVTDIYPL